MKTSSLSIRTFWLLMLLVIIAKLTWIACHFNHHIVQQFPTTWAGILLATGLGWFAVRLAPASGFPDLWDDNISNTRRLLLPVILGLLLGICQIILLDKLLHLPVTMVELPLAIPVYLAAGIVSEVFFRLIPLVFATWLISGKLLGGKGQSQTFWIIAILFSLAEPVLQVAAMYQIGLVSSSFLLSLLFTLVFAANIVPAWLFRKSGFLAPLMFRLSAYLVWHILRGFFL